MPIETIEYKGYQYPAFQATHNSSRFVMPFAIEVCKGNGLDIGAGRHAWSLPGSCIVDPAVLINGYHAKKLPLYYDDVCRSWDYIFSSHCLEHIEQWVETLDYWLTFIKPGGVLFLYLPDHSQKYWSYGNKKHCNVFTPKIIHDFMFDRGLNNIFVSGVDLNNSFAAMAETP